MLLVGEKFVGVEEGTAQGRKAVVLDDCRGGWKFGCGGAGGRRRAGTLW